MKRTIYFFYFCILLSATTWRLANAGSAKHQLKNVFVVESEGSSDLVMSMDKIVKPISRFSGTKNCLTLDFPATEVSPEIAGKALAGRDIKLAYLDEGDSEDGFARLRIYIKSDCLAAVRFADNKVIVRLTEKSGMSGEEAGDSKVLLNPQESNYSPAVISLQDAPFEPAVQELAGQAGIELRFAGPLPELFSLELEAASPLEALKGIADVCKLRFFRDGKTWVMSGA